MKKKEAYQRMCPLKYPRAPYSLYPGADPAAVEVEHYTCDATACMAWEERTEDHGGCVLIEAGRWIAKEARGI
jgi:hypothetical protein